VDTSTIPNAGNGVFLTFLGARELKPSRKRRGEILSDERPHKELRLAQPMTACHQDGFNMSVTVAGKHLHCPYSCPYLLPTLRALVPDDGLNNKEGRKEIKVRFSDFDLPYYEDELAGLRDPSTRIGFLRLHRESDYVPAPKRTFSSLHERCGLIDIGRYGPFRKCGKSSSSLCWRPTPSSKVS
jgi:hypothetical protein